MTDFNYEEALLRARETFYIEARDMLDQMEEALLAWEQDPSDREVMNALF